jgi:asparagine synthase (glutamine-hydrolysing)
MCGITGIALPGGERPNAAIVRAMTDALSHRGPDGDGLYVTYGCALGHRRLAIVDLTPAGAQPMITAEKDAALAFNGEIYDFAEARARLAHGGETFRSRSDTEVLLLALRRYGPDALHTLHGMMAFAYWSARDRSLLLARDRFGKKPLYYAPLGGPDAPEGIAFASELRALFKHPRVWAERSIDPVAAAQFLVHEAVPAPHSIVANVRKLGAGEQLTWTERDGLRIERWYRPRFGAQMRGDTRALTEEFSRRVTRAVARRLVADVPVGIFLSGGLDSSLVTACAVETHPAIKTFSIGFEDPSFDERTHAEAVARHLGTEHHTEVLSSEALVDTVLPTLDWMDEPHADTSILPTSMLARLARRHVTVALGGDGGDETLAGYPTFVVDEVLGRMPPSATGAWLTGALARALPTSGANFSTAFKLRQLSLGLGARGAERHARWLAALSPEMLHGALSGPLRAGLGPCLDAARATVAGTVSDFDAATAFYLGVYLADGVLQKVDRATMRVSLEARAPLLDTEVVEFSLALAPEHRVRGGVTKRIMRRALRGRVPDAIIDRAKKGFGAPVGQWLRGPLRTLLTDTLSREGVARVGWFEPAFVARHVDEHLTGRADHRKVLYALLVLEHWRTRWLEGAP